MHHEDMKITKLKNAFLRALRVFAVKNILPSTLRLRPGTFFYFKGGEFNVTVVNLIRIVVEGDHKG